ncbi:MAG: purine-nucleoside phosphorylase [Eubacterium sp.]|nr:purine-nucleoside phosphorylase [Eubacterium sp.]
MTPHIAAEMGDFAKTVLMPGDPKRSAYIAEHFLEAPKLVNNLRGVQGYTGYYKDVPVSVMASGMGIPSISIYAHELYTFFGVENIIRVGTAGALRADMPLGTVVAGMAACTDSNVMSQLGLDAVFAPTADFMLLANAVSKSRELGMNMSVGSLYSTDLFYDDLNRWKKMADLGVLAIEMEAAGLYLTAAQTGQKALAICSISDNMITGVAMDGKERESAFRDMMIIALETAKAMDKLPVA